MRKHYIGMAGLRGYMPNLCELYPTFEGAVEGLLFIHDIEPDPPDWWLNDATPADMGALEEDREIAAELRDTGYAELAHHGNEYMEVTECSCATPWIHTECEPIADVIELLDLTVEEVWEMREASKRDTIILREIDEYLARLGRTVKDIDGFLGTLARHYDVPTD